MPANVKARGLAAAAFPCAHRVFGCFERGFVGLQRCCKRRRNSYKLVLFFSFQTFVMFACVVLTAIMLGIAPADELSSSEFCGNPSLPQPYSDDDMKSATVDPRVTAFCPGKPEENIAISACRTEERNALHGLTVAILVFSTIQFMLSFILALCFLFFTNLPAEVLQHGSKEHKRCTDFLGFMCKSGPTLTRVMHLALMIIAWCFFVVNTAFPFCNLRLDHTANCMGYRADCFYNKFKNCLYYYNYCMEGADPSVCYNDGDASGSSTNDPKTSLAFSGRMDIRLITGTRGCLCALLRQDISHTPVSGAYGKDNYWMSPAGTATITFSKPSACSDASNSVTYVDQAQPPANGEPVLERQECWKTAPQYVTRQAGGAPYLFYERDCHSHKSTLHRRYRMFAVAVISGVMLLTVVGQGVRLVLRPEPWFFRPRGREEYRVLRCLRLVAP